ncbi:MAG TPA: hypothetical protein VKU82_06115 [Planctomycetaceae bacterium]|nr:hypothetical protein [Planctomycetaceae bacterium]
MPVFVHAVGRSDLAPFRMPDRFRQEITYFTAVSGEAGVPKLPAGEYWVTLLDAKNFLDEGIVRIVSPLDSASKAEIAFSEEQENWLEWMVANGVEHVRLS